MLLANPTLTFRKNKVLWPAVSAHFLNKGIGNEQNSVKNSIFHSNLIAEALMLSFWGGINQ
jgi:hypothetical protein